MGSDRERPTELRVGPRNYSVHWDAETWDAHHDPESGAFGTTKNRELMVLINPKQALDQKADTLLHEVLHCCMSVIGHIDNYKGVEDLEEHVVNTMTPWLLVVLRDNPDLIDYILEPW